MVKNLEPQEQNTPSPPNISILFKMVTVLHKIQLYRHLSTWKNGKADALSHIYEKSSNETFQLSI